MEGATTLGSGLHKEQEDKQAPLTLLLAFDITFTIPAQATLLQKEQQQGMSGKGQ